MPICMWCGAAVEGGVFPTCRLWPPATKKGAGTKPTDVAPHHIVRGLADRGRMGGLVDCACCAQCFGPVSARPTQSGNGDGGESPIFPGGWGQEQSPRTRYQGDTRAHVQPVGPRKASGGSGTCCGRQPGPSTIGWTRRTEPCATAGLIPIGRSFPVHQTAPIEGNTGCLIILPRPGPHARGLHTRDTNKCWLVSAGPQILRCIGAKSPQHASKLSDPY